MTAPLGNEVEAVDVVVRCRNEMPHAKRTLLALATQRAPRARVLFLDCGSTDGSREAALEVGEVGEVGAMNGASGSGGIDVTIVDIDPKSYVPGRVLNEGMERTRSPIVAFINADAVPLHDGALGELIAPLCRGGSVAATFGKQVARGSADAQTKADYARAFGDGAAVKARYGAFFSMAASAIRRDVWEALPFDPALRYSEDVDWTHRASALGWTVEYVPAAVFEHSHDYDLYAHFKRRAGEGAADKAIFRLGAPSVVRDLIRPLAGSVVRDARSGILSPSGLAARVAQAAGYFAGRARATRR